MSSRAISGSSGIDNNNHNLQQLKEKQDRITSLNKQRHEELESRKWMSSRPEREHSFGRYKFFEQSKFYCVFIAMRAIAMYVSYDKL